MTTFPASDAERAASWMLDLEDRSLRQSLYSGHRARRRPATDAQGFRTTDHSAADAWLVDQWRKATGQPVPEIEECDGRTATVKVPVRYLQVHADLYTAVERTDETAREAAVAYVARQEDDWADATASTIFDVSNDGTYYLIYVHRTSNR